MFKHIQKKLRGDRGDSSVVSTIIVIPLLLGLLFTIIDISIYFANRSYIQTVASSGARTVAIMGGNGSALQATAIEKKYGEDRKYNCDQVKSDYRAATAKTTASTAIECGLMVDLQYASGLVNSTITSVKCTPSSTSAIGQRTSCAIQWNYAGTPGSALSFLRLAQTNTTAGSSASEVNLNGALVPR